MHIEYTKDLYEPSGDYKIKFDAMKAKTGPLTSRAKVTDGITLVFTCGIVEKGPHVSHSNTGACVNDCDDNRDSHIPSNCTDGQIEVVVVEACKRQQLRDSTFGNFGPSDLRCLP
jgi:hypothetical protein